MKRIILIVGVVIVCVAVVIGVIFYKNNTKKEIIQAKTTTVKSEVKDKSKDKPKAENVVKKQVTNENKKPENESLTSKNSPTTIGFIDNIVNTKILPVKMSDFNINKVLEISREEASKDLNESFNPNFNSAKFAGTTVLTVSAYTKGSVTSFFPKDTQLPQANYIIDNVKAYTVAFMPGETYFGHGKLYGIAVIGANGKVYNNVDLYNAAEKGELQGIAAEQLQSGSDNMNYIKITPEMLANNFKLSSTVVPGSGNCIGIICSKDNGEPANWQPPIDNSQNNNQQVQNNSQQNNNQQQQVTNSQSQSPQTAEQINGWNSSFKQGYVGPFCSKEYNQPNIEFAGYEQALGSGCGIMVSHVNVVENNEFPAGIVISVSPKVGTHLGSNGKVEITISGGKTKEDVQNFLAQNPGIENGDISQ